MFLRKKDYKPQIRTEVLSIISGFDDETWQTAVTSAISRMTGYLQARFVTAKIFAPLVPWNIESVYAKDTRIIGTADAYNTTLTYEADDLAVKDNKLYNANATTTGTFDLSKWDFICADESLFYVTATTTTAGTLPTDTSEYTAGDTRTAVIVETVIDLAVYLLHSNGSRAQMPEARLNRFEMAIDWLKEIRDGKIEDDTLPIRINEDGTVKGTLFSWGSDESFNASSW